MAVANSKRTKVSESIISDKDLEKEAMRLTSKWCRYVALDHCKSRDFYWYVTKTYDHGERAEYVASHNGYRMDTWESKSCKTEREAMILMIAKLNKSIKEEIEIIEQLIEENEYIPEEDRWTSIDELQKQLKVLKS